MNTVPQSVQSQLQRDEHLLWWNSPKMHLPAKGILFDTIFILVLSGILIFSLIYYLNSGKFFSQWGIGLYLSFIGAVALINFLRIYLRTWNAFFWQSPPYRKHTVYAITDQRALMILSVPGAPRALVLSYLPSEIIPPSSRKLRSGASTITFAAERQVQAVDTGPFFTLPGSFYSIAEVQQVSHLLEQLSMQLV